MKVNSIRLVTCFCCMFTCIFILYTSTNTSKINKDNQEILKRIECSLEQINQQYRLNYLHDQLWRLDNIYKDSDKIPRKIKKKYKKLEKEINEINKKFKSKHKLRSFLKELLPG